MIEVFLWVFVGFASGAFPSAVVIAKIFSFEDVRSVGDGNPGTVNAWKSGGWVPGLIALVLEIGKGAVPVYFAMRYFGYSPGILSQIGLSVVAIAPILGHGWSPFLKFRGGKALATTWGSWIAITNGGAFLVGCVLLGSAHVFQKNHALTVTICLTGFLVVFAPLQIQLYIPLFWILNFAVVVYKHRAEYSVGVLPRDWVLKLARRLT